MNSFVALPWFWILATITIMKTVQCSISCPPSRYAKGDGGPTKIVPHLQNCGSAPVSKISLQPALFKTHICLPFGEYNKYIGYICYIIHIKFARSFQIRGWAWGSGDWEHYYSRSLSYHLALPNVPGMGVASNRQERGGNCHLLDFAI